MSDTVYLSNRCSQIQSICIFTITNIKVKVAIRTTCPYPALVALYFHQTIIGFRGKQRPQDNHDMQNNLFVPVCTRCVCSNLGSTTTINGRICILSCSNDVMIFVYNFLYSSSTIEIRCTYTTNCTRLTNCNTIASLQTMCNMCNFYIRSTINCPICIFV